MDQPAPAKNQFIFTADGSPTLYCPKHGEHHHSLIGAYTEAREKYVVLAEPWLARGGRLRVLDLPFGLGYNLAALLAELDQAGHDVHVDCTAVELDQTVISLISQYPADLPLSEYFKAIADRLSGSEHQLRLLRGDLLTVLPDLVAEEADSYDLIFYDPFSPRVAPALWSQEQALKPLASLLAPSGLLVTYTASPKVRQGLLRLGLAVGPSRAVGRKMPGTVASWSASCLRQGVFSAAVSAQIARAKPYP